MAPGGVLLSRELFECITGMAEPARCLGEMTFGGRAWDLASEYS